MNFPTSSPPDSAQRQCAATASARSLAGAKRGLGRMILVAGAVCQFGGASPLRAAATPPPTLVPPPAATPAATPETAPKTRGYDGVQQSQYIKTAQNTFVEARGAKADAFVAANNTYQEAGGASVKGLSSKEAITQRRELIQKARETNDDYLAFVETQDATYRDALVKTPLIQEDVDALVAEFSSHAKADLVKKLRLTERDMLKTGDLMMDFLEKKYGSWKLDGNKLSFKKAADTNAFSALGKKYNGYVEGVQKMSAEINAPATPPGASPAPGPGTAAPADAASSVKPAPLKIR